MQLGFGSPQRAGSASKRPCSHRSFHHPIDPGHFMLFAKVSIVICRVGGMLS